MSRLRRQYVEGQTYHTISVTMNRAPLFADPQSATVVVNALAHLGITGKAFVLAYAVMPDHLHLLLAPRAPHNVSNVMHSIKSYSARQIQQQTGHKGPVWQASFLDRIIRDDAHLATAIEYIEHNLVAAGLVTERDAYPHSSAHPGSRTDIEAFWAET